MTLKQKCISSPRPIAYLAIFLPSGNGTLSIGVSIVSPGCLSGFTLVGTTCPHSGHVDSDLGNRYPQFSHCDTFSGVSRLALSFPIPSKNIFLQSLLELHAL